MGKLLALTYRGNGGYRPTLPARNLDWQDIEAISQRQNRGIDDIEQEAVTSGLYEAVYESDEAEAQDAEEKSYADLQARAKELDLPANIKKADLIVAIAAAEAEIVAKAAADAAAAASGDDSGAAAPSDPAASAPADGDTAPAAGANPGGAE